MATWFVIECGAVTCEVCFSAEEGAELFALAMGAVTGEVWHVRRCFGSDR